MVVMLLDGNPEPEFWIRVEEKTGSRSNLPEKTSSGPDSRKKNGPGSNLIAILLFSFDIKVNTIYILTLYYQFCQ